jgi:hypothetical protein
MGKTFSSTDLLFRTEQEIHYSPGGYDIESGVHQIRQPTGTQNGNLDSVIGTVTSLRTRLLKTRGSKRATGMILISRQIRPHNIVLNGYWELFSRW